MHRNESCYFCLFNTEANLGRLFFLLLLQNSEIKVKILTFVSEFFFLRIVTFFLIIPRLKSEFWENSQNSDITLRIPTFFFRILTFISEFWKIKKKTCPLFFSGSPNPFTYLSHNPLPYETTCDWESNWKGVCLPILRLYTI